MGIITNIAKAAGKNKETEYGKMWAMLNDNWHLKRIDVEVAQNQFDNALPEYVESAAYNLSAAVYAERAAYNELRRHVEQRRKNQSEKEIAILRQKKED